MDTFNFVVKNRNGVKGLVDSGITTLPSQYILPPAQRLDPKKILEDHPIPVIDVSNWDDPTVTEAIKQAAIQWGFFQIINHGVPTDVLNAIQKAAHNFYDLPNEERKKYWKGTSSSDTVFLATSFSPHTETTLEWKDFMKFHFVYGNEEASALWPSVCRNEVLAYMHCVRDLMDKLLQSLLKGLNVNQLDEGRKYMCMGLPILNLNYYPRCPNPELAAGVGRHCDISTFTILLQDSTGGLFVSGVKDDTWIPVPPVDGALVINVGDILQILSNGIYKSIEHRAIAHKTKNRVSIPVFVSPAFDAVVAPFPELLGGGDQPLYREVIYSDYVNHFFSKPHDGKSTIEFARK